MKDELALSVILVVAIIASHFTYQDQIALGIMILASLYGGYCAYHHNRQQSVILALGPGLFLILTLLASFSAAVGGYAAFMWLIWFGMLCWFGWTCDAGKIESGAVEATRPDDKVDVVISRNKFCPECGTAISGAFCSNCGKSQ